jgi:Protein of unknown function (DUF1353)
MKRFCQRSAALLAGLVCLAGCVTAPYDPELQGGDFSGEIILGWDDGIRFIYYPSDRDPLIYTFPEGHPLKDLFGSIRPGPMYTDGGSIPRALWSVEGFSVWEYGPAYILHDWLFQRHYCEKDSFKMSLKQANAVLLDAMVLTDKKLSERPGRQARDRAQIRSVIDQAVQTFSKTAWDNGTCPPAVKDPYRYVTVTAKRPGRVELASGRIATVRVGETYRIREPNFTVIARLKVGGS